MIKKIKNHFYRQTLLSKLDGLIADALVGIVEMQREERSRFRVSYLLKLMDTEYLQEIK